jgi:hypothetical protein
MIEKTMPITGGCLCGAVRFEATEPPSWVAYCHCRMCQKACGQPYTIVVGFMGEKKGALRFTTGEPKYYKSSAWWERAFCADCGSPLGARHAEVQSVMVGTLDHPEEWPPEECHTGIESQIPWDIIHDDLPRWRTEDDPDYVAAKEAAEQGEG